MLRVSKIYEEKLSTELANGEIEFKAVTFVEHIMIDYCAGTRLLTRDKCAFLLSKISEDDFGQIFQYNRRK